MHTMVKEILARNNIQLSSKFLKLRLESHPDYPALTAVQDTLEELGIDAFACTGTKEELKNQNSPFLAHLNIGDGEIRFFKNVTDAEKRIIDFDKLWSGHVMFINKPLNYGNPQHDKQYRKENRNHLFVVIAGLLFISSFFALPIYIGNLAVTFFIASNLIGLYFSWLIMQKEFGVSNSISDKICSMARHSHCEAVLHSKAARLFGWLTWGDVGMVYFTSSLLFLLLNLLTNRPITLYHYLSFSGLVFPFYSLYYQWQVAKQWCMLCIGVLIALFINAVIAFTQVNGASVNSLWNSAALFILIATGTLSVWQLVKDVYQQSLKALQNEIKATRLKRNPEIFNALLEKQTFNHSNLPVEGESIYFGNAGAFYQLTIASSPFCGPCSTAHHAIEKLYEKHPEHLAVAIRFSLHSNDVTENNVVAAKHIIKLARKKPLEVLRDWYQTLSVEKMTQLHQDNVIDSNSIIEQHIAWTKDAQITATPTLFVNGRMLPEIYSLTDFIGLVEHQLKQ